MKTSRYVRALSESAMMISLGTVLSIFKIVELPYGGSVTIASMLPVIILAYRHGLGWGLGSGAVYAVLQQLLGLNNLSYVSGWQSIVAVIALDYVAAFAVVGLGGVFRGQKNKTLGIVLCVVLALSLRYVAHTMSGYIFFGAWAEWFFTQEGFYSIGESIMSVFSGKGLALVYSVFYH